MTREMSWLHAARRAALAAGVMFAVAAPISRLAAQALYACYVPSSGTVYRIKTPNTKQACVSDTHVEFSWTSAAGADHGSLGGLTDDDHPQYLLTNGVRAATNGFAIAGTLGVGTIPTTGDGVRLMWYPRKAAFRAGLTSGGRWDDANVGDQSVAFNSATRASGFGSAAFGTGTVASGVHSAAMGLVSTASADASIATGAFSTASGSFATAMGGSTVASGLYSTALGRLTTASGHHAISMGRGTIASGESSTAMGVLASTSGQGGSFVYGDNSTLGTGALVSNTAANQFMVRAVGGTIFYSNSALTAGVSLAPGGGSWDNVSDFRRKENFRDVSAETVLEKLRAMPIREWNYKSQDAAIRHLGPTAQDFYAAFGFGGSDTTITTIDANGVALLAIQALERRTTELQAAHRALEARTSELEALQSEFLALRTELSRMLAKYEAARPAARPNGSH